MRKAVTYVLPALAGLSGLLSAMPARGDVIEQFDFAGQTGAEATAAPATVATGLTAGALYRGAGLNASSYASGSFGNDFPGAEQTTAAAAETDNEYNAFTITTSPGYEMSLTNVEFSGWVQNQISGNPSFNLALFYSTNGTSFIEASTTNNYAGGGAGTPTGHYGGTGPILYTADLSGVSALQDYSGPVYLQIVYYGGAGYINAGLGSETGNTQDLLVNGAVSPTPEPGSLFLLSIIAPALLRRGSRRGSTK